MLLYVRGELVTVVRSEHMRLRLVLIRREMMLGNSAAILRFAQLDVTELFRWQGLRAWFCYCYFFHRAVRCHNIYLPNMRFAFALILAALALDSFPRFTICVARAFAFAACERSGIGYFLLLGKPNALDFSLLRRAVRSLAMPHPQNFISRWFRVYEFTRCLLNFNYRLII